MKKATIRTDVVEALTLDDLCRFCQADRAWVVELVEEGVLEPLGASEQHWRFEGVAISRAKRARRLNRDLGINVAGVAMVLDLLDEREEIMRRLVRHEEL